MWKPQDLDSGQPLYRAIVDCLVQDITDGTLEAGARLPTVRGLADAMGVNMGTVYRAYTLAEQRGILNKEVGRGSFVRSSPAIDFSGPETPRSADAGADLTRNEPPFLPLDGLLRHSLKEISRDSVLDGMMEYGHSQGLPRHREELASWLSGSQGFSADPDRLIITGGAQQGLTIALGALTNPGDTLLVEELSYPGVHNLARFFGITLKPVALDEQGIVPSALDQACRESNARVLYCMPHAHNPTTATMSAPRRADVATVLDRYGLMVIEDDVNTHGVEETYQPLAALLPERIVYISSLSKIVAPGLRVGMIVAPHDVFAEILAASQTTSWMAPPLMAELACLWIRNGMVRDLVARRDVMTAKLLATARQSMQGVPIRFHMANTHLWLALPSPWSSQEFAEMALARGVHVSPSSQFSHFAGDHDNTHSGIRICLRELPDAQLHEALSSVAQLYREIPRPQAFSM